MRFLSFLAHLFVPHESNNQKARILHSGSIFFIATLLIGFQLVVTLYPRSFPQVLGYAANISPSEVIRLTNEKRSQNGLSPLSENSMLSQAALAKGQDMLSKGYWAHFAPDGTSPWSFFASFGYKYRYAGENLARDFSNPASAVDAWMNSPSHKENLLNANYKDIGIGVVEGNLSGAETTIIVQFFGTPSIAQAAIPVANAATTKTTLAATLPPVSTTPKPSITPLASPTLVATATPVPTPTPTSLSSEGNQGSNVLVSPFQSSKNLALSVTGLILLILSIDLVIVRRKAIERIGGRTLAHIAYLAMILAVILILKAGQII